jgi:hypothetical protein
MYEYQEEEQEFLIDVAVRALAHTPQRKFITSSFGSVIS